MSLGFNKMDEIVHLEGVGDIRIVKSKKARRLSIFLKPFEGIRVTIPKGVSERETIRFIQERYDWIEKSYQKMLDIEGKRTHFDEESTFRTRTRELVIKRIESDRFSSRITKRNINISIPHDWDMDALEVQEKIRAVIHKALRKEAKEFLPRRTEELAKSHGFEFKEVLIRNNKTRWGSCTGDNKICLNLHLMRLPDYLIDYVILHELTHTVVKNHSRKYWSTLDSVCPGSKHLDRDLSRYSTYLY